MKAREGTGDKVKAERSNAVSCCAPRIKKEADTNAGLDFIYGMKISLPLPELRTLQGAWSEHLQGLADSQRIPW